MVLREALEALAENSLACVIDGDSIEVAGERIRLYGIDSPEAKQTCREWAQSVEYACGQHATAVAKITRSRRS